MTWAAQTSYGFYGIQLQAASANEAPQDHTDATTNPDDSVENEHLRPSLNQSLTLAFNLHGGRTESTNGRLEHKLNYTRPIYNLTSQIRWLIRNDESNTDRITNHHITWNGQQEFNIHSTQWKPFIRLEAEHKTNTLWETRFGGYVGISYLIFDEATFEWKASLGLGGHYEFGMINRSTPEAFFSGTSSQWSISQQQKLISGITWYPQLDSGNDYRLKVHIEWQAILQEWRGATLSIGFENEYNSDYREDNEDSGHDYRIYTGLGFNF